MMTPYTGYVRYMLQFYFRSLDKTSFKNDRDRINWEACNKVVNRFPTRDRDVFRYVYGEFDTLADNVFMFSRESLLNQDVIWKMLYELEKEVAIERGLWL